MTTYYNEIDSFAAQWLQNHFGDAVDERSIRDVRSTELSGFDRCHFFAGIGGWEIALRLAGWPDDWPVWTGSCPCQPFSAAGRRKGEADERHLWPEFRRLIAECLPATVFGEQVASQDGRLWLSGVRADLEALGYAVGAADLCAASVGAPHIRQRLFWVAHRSGTECEGWGEPSGERRGAFHPTNGGEVGRLSDAERSGIRMQGRGENEGTTAGMQRANGERERVRSDAGAIRATEHGGLPNSMSSQSRGDAPRERATTSAHISVADQLGRHCPIDGMGDRDSRGPSSRSAPAEANGHGRAAEPNGSDGPWGEFVLVPCADGVYRRLKPGLAPLAYGIPRRTGPIIAMLVKLGHSAADARRIVAEARRNRIGQIKGYGNAIVPQLAAEFIRAFVNLQEAEREK